MDIAIVNPILQTLNYPTEKEPAVCMQTDEFCNIVELAKEISKQGNQVTVFASDSFKPRETVAEKEKNVMVRYLPTRFKAFFHPAVLPFCPTLSREIKKHDFDAIIATEHYQISTVLAALSKRKRTKLLLWQELDREFQQFAAGQIQKIYSKTLFRFIEKRFDAIVPRSNSAKAFLKKICKKKEIISEPIHTGVNTSFFKPKKTKCDNFVLDVTRLNKDRNLHFLLQTARETKELVPKTRFVVAGSGPEKAWLEEQKKTQQLSQNISVDAFPREKMPGLYNKSALTIIHSTGGLFPFAALESMACGKPVVSSFKGALLDLIEENKNGFFVETPREMAQRITLLLENKKKLNRFGKDARKRVEKDFSMETTARNFLGKIEGAR